jgi:hypothetical protein
LFLFKYERKKIQKRILKVFIRWNAHTIKMALQQVLNVPRRFDELLNLVNKGALRAAMNSVLSNKQPLSQFKLFVYESGVRYERGVAFRVEELVPGTNIQISDYVYSEEFYNELIGKGVPELKFRLWSRYAKDSGLVRELMLEIKRATFNQSVATESVSEHNSLPDLESIVERL